jgi:hypothetical protein
MPKKNPPQSKPLQRTSEDGALVCPGCHKTMAINEKYGVTNKKKIKFHNLDCERKYENAEKELRRKARLARQTTTAAATA